jgi:hypothetical protein
MTIKLLFAAVIPLALAACVPGYTLVKPGTTAVAASPLTVQPGEAWNRVPKSYQQTKWDEVWTKNGPMLDSVSFVAGVPDGTTIIVQRNKKETRRVPPFRADMTPQDLVSMMETSYRVRGVTVFEVESVDPVQFLGGQGLRMSFRYAPNETISKKGVCVMRVIDQKLYAMTLEGVTSHYFKAAGPEFDSLLASAALKK